MSVEAVHEDMAAHTRVRGQTQAQRYYTRALGQIPTGPGAALVHAEGSQQGGGYEWSTAPIAAPPTPCATRSPPATPGPGVIFHSDRGCRYTSAA